MPLNTIAEQNSSDSCDSNERNKKLGLALERLMQRHKYQNMHQFLFGIRINQLQSQQMNQL